MKSLVPIRGRLSELFAAWWLVLTGVGAATAQVPVESYLANGEFSLALQQTRQGPLESIDLNLQKIAYAQRIGGASQGAWQTANQIGNASARNETLGGMFNPRGPGQGGGVTEADFQPLIDLIQSTIAPDEWTDTGQGDGTIQPWPAGVYVDARGSLHRIHADRTGQLAEIQRLAGQLSPKLESSGQTHWRTLSLVQLERAAQFLAAQGKPLTPWMKNLGGMYAVKYVVAQPDRQDLLLVGPAGPWKVNAEGIPINLESGLPVLQLDDLVVCLRNIREHRGVFGCSITPRQENLAAAKEFIAQSRLSGANWREGLRGTLGQQDIEVFGVDPDTHLAGVLVEADYRMKLVGMGIEPSVAEIPSYLDRVELLPDGSAPPLDVARWWFTLNYDRLTTDSDRRVFGLEGTGVKVLSETEFINHRGERIHTGQSQGPTKEFAEDFTTHFEKIARKYPIYHQLRGVFDLALVAALIEREGLGRQVNWEPTYFGPGSTSGKLVYQTARRQVSTQVDSIMNHRTLRDRQGGRARLHTIVGVSGGIHCDFYSYLESQRRSQPHSDGSGVTALPDFQANRPDSDSWWWDSIQ